MLMVKTEHVRLYDHGYGIDPLYVLHTTLGYFSRWLGIRGDVAECENDWLAARKFKTIDDAVNESLLIPGCQIVTLKNQSSLSQAW